MTCLETLFLLYFWHLNNFCPFLYFLLLLRGNEVLLYGKLNVYDWYLLLFMCNTSFKNISIYFQPCPFDMPTPSLSNGSCTSYTWSALDQLQTFQKKKIDGCWNVQRKFSEMKCRLLLFHWPAKAIVNPEKWPHITDTKFRLKDSLNSSADLL